MTNAEKQDEVRITEADEAMIKRIADMADGIWHEHYAGILSPDQIDYMVAKFQSEEAMHRQCAKEGYHYEAILLNGKLAGYIGWALHEDELFLSKLYLAKPFRKHGLAAAALSHLKKEAAKAKKESILLTVNRYNQDSVEVYRHWGFATIREEKTPIGEGYVMDDYIMRLMLSPKESASC